MALLPGTLVHNLTKSCDLGRIQETKRTARSLCLLHHRCLGSVQNRQ